jgi:CDP-paratose 2-epimerase
MPVSIVTGASGLVGSEAVLQLASAGFDVIGVDSDARARYFGVEASTASRRAFLRRRLGSSYAHQDLDVQDGPGLMNLVNAYAGHVEVFFHAAAQPSHDWAASRPIEDFMINAVGTLNCLEAMRRYSGNGTFLFVSTNKVYGDAVNDLPLVRLETRYELEALHPFANGVTESMGLDQTMHSLFGVSKAAADLLVQEYGRYYDMATCVFRPGTITGPAHAAAMQHGFLAYLVKMVVVGGEYQVFGYEGLQVRDVIHVSDLVSAMLSVLPRPKPGSVYNIGGGRHANCSVVEAIRFCEEIAQKRLNVSFVAQPRRGDHKWWISSTENFRSACPQWSYSYNLSRIISELVEVNYRNL